jgi:cytochrome d ubiquinol oxidase subunit II
VEAGMSSFDEIPTEFLSPDSFRPQGLRWFRAARVLAAAEVALILSGWALALYPYLVPPDISIATAAAPPNVLRLVLWGTAAGLLILVPSLLYLFRVFKTPQRDRNLTI